MKGLLLEDSLSKATLRQMSRVILAMLAMSGRVTMLGVSRWAEAGGSYRSIQRFYPTAIPWAQVFRRFAPPGLPGYGWSFWQLSCVSNGTAMRIAPHLEVALGRNSIIYHISAKIRISLSGVKVKICGILPYNHLT